MPMRYLPSEIAKLRAALPVRPTPFSERRLVISRVRRVLESLALAVVMSVVVIAVSESLETPILLAGLWAAPMALMARSLFQMLLAIVIVTGVFVFSGPQYGVRSLPDIAAFVLAGVFLLLATGVLFGRYIQDRQKTQRERDLFQNAFATLHHLLRDSALPIVWLDGANSWILANPAALKALGIQDVLSMAELGGRAEHGAMVERMHSGSKDAWLALVEEIDGMRPQEESAGGRRSLAGRWGLTGQDSEPTEQPSLKRSVRLSCANGDTASYQAIATLVDERNVLVRLVPTAG